MSLGWPEIAATFVDVDDDEAARILLVDNRLNDTSPGYDNGLLLSLLTDLGDLDGTGYDAQALDELVTAVNAAAEMPLQVEGDPDAAPDLPMGEPTTKRGDIWVCGRHRVMCADSTNIEDVETLIGGRTVNLACTDPRYGVEIVQGGWVGGGEAYNIPFGGVKNRAAGTKPTPKTNSDGSRATRYAPVIGDDTIQTAIDAYNVCVTLKIPVLIFWGGNYYASALPNSSCWIVWDKQNNGNFADAELAWTNQKSAVRLFQHMWNGMVKASEHGEKRVHPTQKPCALFEWCYEQYGARGDTVLDLFGGSGVALISAERSGRTALIMELSESYVDVICQRYQRLTGIKPILESTGEPVDFMAGKQG